MADLHPQQFERLGRLSSKPNYAARRAPIPGQLDMFKPAHKLAGMKMGDAHARESNASVMQRKRAEMEGRGIDRHYGDLKNDLQKRGITDPVKIWHDNEGGEKLNDGHHRVTWAADTNPNMEVPVMHAAPFHHSYDW